MTQSLYEYQFDATPGAPGLIADGWSYPRLLYRSLAGGRSKQYVDLMTISGFTSTGASVSISITFTLPDATPKTITATATYSASVNTNELAAYVVASKLMEDLDFNQVLVAYANGNTIIIEARQFGTAPMTAITTAVSGSATITPASPTIFAPQNTNIVPFGFVVGARSTDRDNVCEVYNGTAMAILGIALISKFGQQYPPPSVPLSSATPIDHYKTGDTVCILSARSAGSRVWVPVLGNPTKYAPVYVDNATGQIKDTNTSATLFPNATFLTEKINGLAIIEL